MAVPLLAVENQIVALTVLGPLAIRAAVTVRGRSGAGGSSRERRRSWSWRSPVAVKVNRASREARSRTAQTRVRQLASPESR